MKLLLDTHLVIWAAEFPERLSDVGRALLSDTANVLTFSVVSLWEIAIKRRLGRSDFELDPRVLRMDCLENGYEELAITAEHAFQTGRLPRLHRDPFDRMLIAQAAVEGLTLLTADQQVAAYPGPVRQV